MRLKIGDEIVLKAKIQSATWIIGGPIIAVDLAGGKRISFDVWELEQALNEGQFELEMPDGKVVATTKHGGKK